MREVWKLSEASWEGPPIALFWDQSLVWGLMCLETLRNIGVPHRLVTSRDICAGALDAFRIVLVPGGWASHKVEALGEAGKARLEEFVRHGGSYLGFCGGAGMALSSPPSLGLVPLTRRVLAERLPSASGEIWIEGNPDHPVWKDLPGLLPVTVWWPSQFHNPEGHAVTCVASYRATGSDFMVADLHVGDLSRAHGHGGAVPWERLEKVYGINLNPARLLNDSAIVEAVHGRGRLLLSYPHLETPEDAWGNRLCRNLLDYLDRCAAGSLPADKCPLKSPIETISAPVPKDSLHFLFEARDRVEDLLILGARNLLWRWRNPWLLSWRRGIRGLEYGMLAVSLRWAVSLARQGPCQTPAGESSSLRVEAVREFCREVTEFCTKARQLLMEEKVASQDGGISKLSTVNRSVDELRRELFGKRMNHSGLSRSIFDRLDAMLLELLRGVKTAGMPGVDCFPVLEHRAGFQEQIDGDLDHHVPHVHPQAQHHTLNRK